MYDNNLEQNINITEGTESFSKLLESYIKADGKSREIISQNMLATLVLKACCNEEIRCLYDAALKAFKMFQESQANRYYEVQ